MYLACPKLEPPLLDTEELKRLKSQVECPSNKLVHEEYPG
jgi:hypothetical protein